MRTLFALTWLTSPLFAQTTRVPFVGCESAGQANVLAAPSGVDKEVRINAGAAVHLAYYQEGFRGTGVLAPRGWYCIGSSGSGGSELFITPQPFKGTPAYYQNGQVVGPAIQLDYISADNGSGRFEMAKVLARVFPAQRTYVQDVIASFDFPANEFKFGPFPKDELIVQKDRLVEFRTPPHSEGLGTMTRLKANADPIDGVAIFDAPAPPLLPALLLLTVRLPADVRDLASSVIRQFEREHR